MKASDFYTHHLKHYNPSDARRRSYLSIDVLPELNGRQWDDLALAYVHGLRPSAIRVTKDFETCDAVTWRVTVYVDEHNAINRMRQEVEIWCPDGVENGHDLWLKTRRESPQPGKGTT